MQTTIKTMNAILEQQKAAFQKNPMPTLKERTEWLDAIIAMMLEYRPKILDALNTDFGTHPTLQGDFIEVFGMLARAEYNKTKLDEWMQPSLRETDPSMHGESSAYVLRQPKGVIGNMSPWNFPFDLTIGPLCDMLAAGNRVMIKPSEISSACSELLLEMINATFNEDHVAVVLGDLDVAKAFPALPFDHLLYTGNPGVARQVAAAAAPNLTPLTLELGGKSPTVFTPGGVTAANVADCLRIKMIKNGQMCVSPDYALVPRADLENFVSLAKAFISKEAPDYVAGDDITGIINDRHYARIESILDDARTRESQIEQLTGESDAAARRMALSLVVNPSEDSLVMTEEIFGPIMAVVPYDSLDEGIAYINARERPLGLYVYGSDKALCDEVINRTSSGGVTVNGAALHASLPGMGFGGTGNSGYGRHHGIEGFMEFTNPRGIMNVDPAAMAIEIAPPYGETAKAIHQSMIEG
ncbi:coniferyl aldehyde dehydrogenase [Congregibacter litoralis]|uniref:coniferyl aldehyde dehydrogenase n=1 Tax=Congregibacter litoralis TaxID=393662 RepID=UPI000317BE02|nr:coniferyl aldehyde dehydrogenase [Congregibacter litoralis]